MASRERMSSNVPYGAVRDFGRWEICWGSTLIWKCGHKFCLSASFTHSLSPTTTTPSSAQPPPSSATFYLSLHLNFFYPFLLHSYIFSCSELLWQARRGLQCCEVKEVDNWETWPLRSKHCSYRSMSAVNKWSQKTVYMTNIEMVLYLNQHNKVLNLKSVP